MNPTLQQLLSELALSTHQPFLRDTFFSDVEQALGQYATLKRQQSSAGDVAHCQIFIFGTLWIWYKDLKRSQRNRIFDHLLDIHLASATAAASPSKVEFAFLTGWSQSLQWAESKNLARDPNYSPLREQLLDLCTLLPESQVVETFFGFGPKYTDWAGTYRDEQWLLEMPRTYFGDGKGDGSGSVENLVVAVESASMRAVFSRSFSDTGPASFC
jgi:hypothetical protein